MQVPYHNQGAQHQLTAIGWSYVVLNSCMRILLSLCLPYQVMGL